MFIVCTAVILLAISCYMGCACRLWIIVQQLVGIFALNFKSHLVTMFL